MTDHDDDQTQIRTAWPGLFGDGPPLPDPETDLAPFARAIVPGPRGEPWTSRAANLTDHFRAIEAEFGGLPRLAHLIACTITALRRDGGDAGALMLFDRILHEQTAALCDSLDSRWLTSVCDTVVDTADADADRALALCGTLFVNTLRIAETEMRLYRPARDWPPRARLRHGGEIYDGVQTVWTANAGDMDTLLARIGRGLDQDSPLAPIVATLVRRALDGATVVNRIAGLSGQPRLPIAPAQTVAELRRLMREV